MAFLLAGLQGFAGQQTACGLRYKETTGLVRTGDGPALTDNRHRPASRIPQADSSGSARGRFGLLESGEAVHRGCGRKRHPVTRAEKTALQIVCAASRFPGPVRGSAANKPG